jgi:hypothetical protein
MEYRLGPFCDGAKHPYRIHVLVALLVLAAAVCLPSQGYQRGTVHVGIGDTGDKVGGTGAEGAETHPSHTGQAAEGVSHEGGPLFMAAENELDRRVLQRHHEVGIFLSWNPEDVFNPFILQAFDKQFSSIHPFFSWYLFAIKYTTEITEGTEKKTKKLCDLCVLCGYRAALE